MKKRILFILHKLDCGGVEKALINMLKLIDRDRYECEILVLEKGGSFEGLIPKGIKIKEYCMPDYVVGLTRYRTPKIEEKDGIKKITNKCLWKVLHTINRVIIKLTKKSILYWTIFNKYKKHNIQEEYDAIIDVMGYGSYPTYLAANMAKSKVRVSWIHEQNMYIEYGYIRGCYNNFDKIFGCSLDCCNNFITRFPEYKEKVEVYYNYLDVDEIKERATEKLDEKYFKDDVFKIVSIGRVGGQKSFGRAVTVAEQLKKKGYNFIWVIVGDGEDLETRRQEVKEKGLENYVIFHGFDYNPFKYLVKANLYVQTSIAEGFCTTISEAIVLGKAVVTTDVAGVREQLDIDKGGIIVDQSCEGLLDAISRLIEDRALLAQYEGYNKNKAMDYVGEINKLYKVIG